MSTKRTIFIIVTVIGVLALAAGLAVLIWWLVSDGEPVVDPIEEDFTVISLEGSGIGEVPYTAALTRIRDVGDMFWWFYPTVRSAYFTRPLILWLDGVMGVPPSLLANFGMFGPYDTNLNRRNDSWVEDYNLLFVDAPLGTGFSTANADNNIPRDVDESADHLLLTLESFYLRNPELINTPLHIFGQAHGAQLALALAIRLEETDRFNHTLRGVILGDGIISPAVALTRLGFYLEEMGYIDANGRDQIETLSTRTTSLVDSEYFGEAFDEFLTLGTFVNENAGAVAVNLGYIVEKLTQESTRQDYFGQTKYLRQKLGRTLSDFMDATVKPGLGLPSDVSFDLKRETVNQAFRNSFMKPATDKVEYILQNTELSVTIYNGNLDAVSTTPGQLEWVNALQWTGQTEFISSPRQTLVVDGLVQGYFRETERLTFYWFNAAGQSVPLDSPSAMYRVLQRITN